MNILRAAVRFIPAALVFIFISISGLSAADLSVSAFDTPNDGGASITVSWEIGGAFDPNRELIIQRKSASDARWLTVGAAESGAGYYIDSDVVDGTVYEFRVMLPHNGDTIFATTEGVRSAVQIYNTRLTPSFVGVLICISALLIVMAVYAKGREFYIRPIRGLEAVDEAVGRATEMGRSVLFTPGWGGDIQRPTTIAALNILQHVAAKTAEYRCDLYFPTHDPVIMTAAEEVVREAYIEQGTADAYNADNVFYTTSSQLGYAAAVDGVITRYEPAAIFLLGTFEGEALILAETGNSIGAMQVAGTDSTIQLSFFMVACDYTLIGEELFAASGYLTHDHKILSSVKMQDYLKLLIILALVAGAVLATFGLTGFSEWIGMS